MIENPTLFTAGQVVDPEKIPAASVPIPNRGDSPEAAGNSSKTICYLRHGRKLRASGTVILVDENTRMMKVKPMRDDWGIVWLDEREIAAGASKIPSSPRKPRTSDPSKPRKPRAPKPPAPPRWQQLVSEVESLAKTHGASGSVFVSVSMLLDLSAELRGAHVELDQFLPAQSNATRKDQ